LLASEDSYDLADVLKVIQASLALPFQIRQRRRSSLQHVDLSDSPGEAP
jgi:hypothetical protein